MKRNNEAGCLLYLLSAFDKLHPKKDDNDMQYHDNIMIRIYAFKEIVQTGILPDPFYH